MKITNRWTNATLFEDSAETMRETVQNAKSAKISLRDADLSDADLSGADLSDADLSGAYDIYSFGPIGKEKRIGYAVKHADCVMFKLGCFWGDTKAARAAIVAKYGKNSLYEKQVILAAKILTGKSDE